MFLMVIALCKALFFFFMSLQEDTDPQINESLSIENTLWASTVVASGKW